MAYMCVRISDVESAARDFETRHSNNTAGRVLRQSTQQTTLLRLVSLFPSSLIFLCYNLNDLTWGRGENIAGYTRDWMQQLFESLAAACWFSHLHAIGCKPLLLCGRSKQLASLMACPH
jgi:hypothetical protein